MADALRLEAAALAFCLTVERKAEGQHSVVKRFAVDDDPRVGVAPETK